MNKKQLQERISKLRTEKEYFRQQSGKWKKEAEELEQKLLGSEIIFPSLKYQTEIPCHVCKTPMDISHYQQKLRNQFFIYCDEALRRMGKELMEGMK